MKVTGGELLSDSYYIMLRNAPYNEDNPIEGKDYVCIKCKIEEFGFEKDKEGRLNCLATLSPLQDLPEWYDMEWYIDDFEVPIDSLYDNDFYIPS